MVEVLSAVIPGWKSMHASCTHCPEDSDDPRVVFYRSGRATLQMMIIHLNDHHRFSRETIANWLETLDHDLTIHPMVIEGGEVK